MSKYETPREKIRRRIIEVGQLHKTSLREMMGGKDSQRVTMARHIAINIIHLEYPRMSCTQLAKIFNKHHSVILFALGRLNGKEPTWFSREDRESAVQETLRNLEQGDISREAGAAS